MSGGVTMKMSKKKERKVGHTIFKLQKQLGLTEWEIDWHLAGPCDHAVTNENRASVLMDRDARHATIQLSPFNDAPIHNLMLHELLHVALHDLKCIADRSTSEDMKKEYDVAEHTVINRLLGAFGKKVSE